MEGVTVKDVLKEYEEWLLAHKKAGKPIVQILRSSFDWLMQTPVTDISILKVEKWHTEKKKSGMKSATINRKITALQAMLNYGVRNEMIEENPLSKMQKFKETDSLRITRYLLPQARERLMSVVRS